MHTVFRIGVAIAGFQTLVACSTPVDMSGATRNVSATGGQAATSSGPAGTGAGIPTAGHVGAGAGGSGSTTPTRPVTAIASLVAFLTTGQAGAAGHSGAGGMSGGSGAAAASGSGGTAGSAGAAGASGHGGAGGAAGRAGAGGRGGAGGRAGAGGRSGAGGAGQGGAGGAGGEAAVGGAGAGGAGAGGAGAGGSGGAGGAAGKPAPDVTGSAVFTQTSTGVTLGIALNNCVDGKSYPIHIHMGTSCMDPAAPAGHWDPPRGEGIPDVKCTGSTASENYTRLNSDAKPWSIGDMKDSDMVGHAMVLHDPDDNTKRVACGKIIAQ